MNGQAMTYDQLETLHGLLSSFKYHTYLNIIPKSRPKFWPFSKFHRDWNWNVNLGPASRYHGDMADTLDRLVVLSRPYPVFPNKKEQKH